MGKMGRQRTASLRRADWEYTSDHASVSAAQIMKMRREQLSMGQGELAGKIGYTNPNFVSMLEMGWSRVPLDKIGKIAEALHLPPHWFSERVLAARSNTDGDGFHKFLLDQVK